MAKKENLQIDEITPAIDIEKIPDSTNQIYIEKLRVELAKLGLKIIEDTENPQKIKIEIAEPQKIKAKLEEKIQDPAKIYIEKLQIELAKLGLKIIEDINDKRVPKPEETYNSLIALYNAIKI